MNRKKENTADYTDANEHRIDSDFWDAHWKNDNTGWDIGYASPGITEYMDQYNNKDAAVLIPGCGNAYEGEYLANSGFTNITLLDISPAAVAGIEEKFQDTPQVNVICQDFFEHTGNYDLIIEQTFFCAIPPGRREGYASKAASLLHNDGKIIGVLFDKSFDRSGPPFGGNRSEYRSVFEPYFVIETMNKCYNSIKPREGSELFIELLKK
jgi:SAM-dependent methyltransferase